MNPLTGSAFPLQMNYPAIAAVAFGVLFASAFLVVVGRFDPTHGVLAISILIVLGMLAVVSYSLVFPIPTNDITPEVVGGLSTGFGAVVAYWLGRRKNGGEK